MSSTRKYLFAAALFALSPLLHAQQQSQPTPAFTFSGYGTFGIIHSNARDADYLLDAFKPNGPGYTDRVSLRADSRLGAQLSAQLTPRLSAIVQVLSEQRHDNSFRPSVEWASLKYQFTPNISGRIGRVVLPVFMVTDSRRVGYSNVWVRPPVEVYGLVPVTHNDGVEAIWRMAAGNITNALQVTAGQSTADFPDSGGTAGTVKVRKLISANDTLEIGSTTLRAIYGEATVTIDAFSPLIDAFRQFGPEGVAIADRYALDGRRVRFIGVGASYDPGKWFLMGEIARFETNSLLGTRRAWYASGGYRFGKLTPYLTYARISGGPLSDPGLTLSQLPQPLVPTASFLNGALNQQLGSTAVQSTASIGMRWDLYKSAALKLQYDWVRLGANSVGTFGNIQPQFRPRSDVRLVSAVLDFLF